MDILFDNEYSMSSTFKIPIKFFEKEEIIEFKGLKFRVPSPIEDYLCFVYKDWRTPLENIKEFRFPGKWRNNRIFHEEL